MAKQKWQDKYKDKTGAMIIDPFFIGEYIEEYQVLQGIKFSGGDVHFNDFVRCCSFIFDPNSPFISTYPDLDSRRDGVYEEIGYRGYKDKVFEVLLLLRLYQNNEWTLYCAEQNVFYELIVRANKPVEFEGMDEKKQLDAVIVKDKLMDTLDKLITRIDFRFQKMFGNNEDLMNAAKDVIARTPEERVRKQKNAISN